MFGKTMAKNNPIETPLVNQIKPGTVIEGDIKSNGDIRIDGTLTGTVEAKGKLVIGATGSITGDIVCQNAEILGALKGKIIVSELLTIKATAKLVGDIVTNKLAIEPDANFSGSCSMGGVIKDIKHGERTESQQKVREKTA